MLDRANPAEGALRLPAQPVGSDFDLSLSDEQQLLRDNLSRFATQRMRPRAPQSNETCQTPDNLLLEAHELGLNFGAIPEELGGTGQNRGVVSHVLLAEDLAYGDMGQAAAMLAPLGVVNSLMECASDAQQRQWLPRFVDEKPFAATLAIGESHPRFDPLALRTTAQPCKQGYRLNGSKAAVLNSQDAQLFVIAARLGDDQTGLFLVNAGTPGLHVESAALMGVRAGACGTLMLDDVIVEASARLGEGTEINYRRIVDLSRLGWCALACGAARAAQDYVIPYVNERMAFGEPISHRQSVAFMVANIGIELECMRLMTLRAASLAEQGREFHAATATARLLCADKAMEIGNNAVQLLGGHGFTKEHPVERWYRDLRAVAIMEGGVCL